MIRGIKRHAKADEVPRRRTEKVQCDVIGGLGPIIYFTSKLDRMATGHKISFSMECGRHPMSKEGAIVSHLFSEPNQFQRC